MHEMLDPSVALVDTHENLIELEVRSYDRLTC